MTNYDEILEKLKKSKDYTLLELSNNDSLNIERTKKVLLEILVNEVNKLASAKKLDDLEYIYKIFKYLNNPTTKNEQQEIIDIYSKIITLCDKKMPSLKANKYASRIKKTALRNLEVIDSIVLEDKPKIEDKSVTKVLSYIIYNVNDYNYLYKFIKFYPNNIIITEDDNIIEKLFDEYYNKAKENDKIKMNYYEKIIYLLLSEGKIKLETNATNKLKNQIIFLIKNISNFEMLEENKRSLLFLVNDVYTSIFDVKFDCKKSLRYLYDLSTDIKKYSLDSEEIIQLSVYFNNMVKILKKSNSGYDELDMIVRYNIKIKELNIPIKYQAKLIMFNNSIINHINSKDIIANNNLKTFNEDYKINIIKSNNNEKVNKKYKEIRDCRYKNVITIDMDGTRKYDDGISLERFEDGTRLLGIYISDPTTSITPNIELDREAFRMGKTTANHSMLPNEVADIFSLKQNKTRNVIGLFFKLDNNLKITEFNIEKCLIKVDNNYYYDEVNSILTDSKKTSEAKYFKELLDVSKNINFIRKIRKDREYDIHGVASILIKNYMTIANSFMAEIFYYHPEIPFIYKSNQAIYDKTGIIDNYNNNNNPLEEAFINDEEFLKTIRKAKNNDYINFFVPYASEHRKLRLRAYCHITDPLREYASLQNLRIVKKYLIDKNMVIKYNELSDLRKICDHLNEVLLNEEQFIQSDIEETNNKIR